MTRLISIGECMLELAGALSAAPKLGFGGDTLNTAIYAARSGDEALDVFYCTALGDDPFSDRMLAGWDDEGVRTDLVRRLAGRLPGFYAIETDAAGERHFYYWRLQAAVRELLLPEAEGDALLERLGQADMVYLSGITLAVLDATQRARLLAALQDHREAGLKVAFDGNLRPTLWPSLDDARAATNEALACADIALAGFDDERRLHADADVEACLRRISAAGPGEVVVKDGARGARLSVAARSIDVPGVPVASVVDTTAAGDSFNGAYLAKRLAGDPPEDAARFAVLVASTVIQHPGALIPKAAMPR